VQSPRRMGVRSRRRLRCLPRRLQPHHEHPAPALCHRFLKAAVAYYASLGITVGCIMTDNGSSTDPTASVTPAVPRPQAHLNQTLHAGTNGKAERFIQTALREWACARAYDTSLQRAAKVPHWIHRYNWPRPHGSISTVPTINTLGLTGNNCWGSTARAPSAGRSSATASHWREVRKDSEIAGWGTRIRT
jgi:transposase InsO family protein